MPFGVKALDLPDLRLSGLSASIDEGWSRTEYGPAVAGRAATSTAGRLLMGRMGATDMLPALTEMEDSGRVLVTPGRVDVADWLEELDAVRTGEMCAMAEPGRAGRLFFACSVAFFWAIIVSRRLGLLDMVLFESPIPGRGAASAFLEIGRAHV